MVSGITRNYWVYFKLIYFKIISELPRNCINIFHSILEQKKKKKKEYFGALAKAFLIELKICL